MNNHPLNKLRNLCLLTALVCLLAPPLSFAGFEEGHQAFKQGNYPKALKEFKSSAAKGNSDAKFYLSIMYYSGKGIPQDYAKSAALLTDLAAIQYQRAAYNLGVMYFYGQGVEQDYQQALHLFERAVEQGDEQAYLQLGNMYAMGKGVDQDYNKAADLFGQGASQGYKDALIQLGILYAEGLGVPQNKAIAYALWNLTFLTQYDQRAAQNKAKIAASMSRDEVQDGQKLTMEIGKKGNMLKAIETFLGKDRTVEPN